MTVENNRKFKTTKKLTLPLLSDAGNETARKYGLVFQLPDDLKELYQQFPVDLPRYNGDDSWTLPIPARFVISSGGIIIDAQSDPDYTVRPEPGDIIAALEKLRI